MRIKDGMFDRNSPSGQSKQRQLAGPGVIAPHYEGRSAGFPYRISWEALQENLATHQTRMIDDMRSASTGAEQADELQQLVTVPAQEIMTTFVLRHLARKYADFDPANGFDIDLFIKVFNAEEGAAMVIMEAFPRERRGELSTAYSSTPFFVPLNVGTPGEGRGLIETMVFAEGTHNGETRNSIHERWCATGGLWQLRDLKTIDAMISCCSMSLLIAWSVPMENVAVPQVARDAGGKVVAASLKVVHLKQ